MKAHSQGFKQLYEPFSSLLLLYHMIDPWGSKHSTFKVMYLCTDSVNSQGPATRVREALVSRANIWVWQQSKLQTVQRRSQGGHSPGHQVCQHDGRGGVQVQGGLQELSHQEHEAQPHRGW